MRRFTLRRVVLIASLFCAAVSIAASAQNFAAENLNFADGGNPFAGPLVQGLNGHFYGTAPHGGGPTNCPSGQSLGCGTVFELTPVKPTARVARCSKSRLQAS